MKTSQLLPLTLLALAIAGDLMAQAPAPVPAPAGPAQPPPALPVVPVVVVPAGPQASIAAPPQQGTAARDAGANGQDTLTVDFPETDIRVIISSVADLFDLNVVVPDTLQGKTTIKLRAVTWRQIFSTVLDPAGFTYQEEGNIIKVVSKDSLQQEPVDIFYVPLKYAKAADVVSTVSALVNTTAGGKIAVDTRTNALIITERPTAMNRIRPLVEQLNSATAQVMIETKFIEVTDGDIKNLGVNWSVLKAYKLAVQPAGQFDRTRGQTLNGGIDGQGTADSANTTRSDGTQTIASAAGGGASASLSNTVDSTISNGISQTLNFLNSVSNTGTTSRETTALFTASEFGFVLSALNELSRTKIISSPMVVTENNRLAKINVGEEDPVPKYQYNEQRGSFEVAGFDYKPIGVILEVTPQVSGDIIKLAIKPTVSQKNGSVNFGGAGGAEIPIIATRNVETNVQMKDGSTMGIGGLMRQQIVDSGSRVPLLGNIPILGGLFRTKSKEDNTTNLLIFITAKKISADSPPVESIFAPAQVRSAGILRSDLPGYRDGSDPFLQPAPVAQPPQSIK